MGNSDSKANFREAIVTLQNRPVPATDEAFWTGVFTLPASAEDVFSLIAPNDVRELRKRQPINLATLLRKAVDFMSKVVHDGNEKVSSEDRWVVLNCVRMVTRIMPFLFENAADDFVERVMWHNLDPSIPLAVEDDGEIQVAGQENAPAVAVAVAVPAADVSGASDTAAGAAAGGAAATPTLPLAARLIDALMGLCFIPNFTVHPPTKPKVRYEPEDPALNSYDPALMWVPGLGNMDGVPNWNNNFDLHRTEVLKALLVCFSETLYTTPDQLRSDENRWLLLATNPSCRNVRNLYFSLMNIGLSYDPVGYGVPYGSVFVSDYREALADISLQVLNVLLDYTPPPPDETDSEAADVNLFKALLANMKDTREIDWTFERMTGLLNNVISANNTYLPNSLKQITFYQELLILFWKLVDENKVFLRRILLHNNINDMVVPIVYFMYEGRKDPSKLGLIHICTFLLLLLSGEREFGVSLNQPFIQKLPLDLPLFNGNHADLIVIVFHKIITNGPDKLDSLYNCLFTILSNLSPYLKSLCLVSCVKLLNLFEIFTSNRWLFSAESNHHLVFFLLDVFNNIIQYQYEGNQPLVYAILRRKKAFDDLAHLTWPIPKREKAGASPVNAEAANELKRQLDAQHAASEQVDAQPVVPPAASAAQEEEAKEAEAPAAAVTITTSEEEKAKMAELEGKTMVAPASEAQQALNLNQGPTEWQPTTEWLQGWKERLPLQTINRLLLNLLPRVEEMSVAKGFNDEAQVLDFLRKTTMVGLLPVPHPIVIRKYQPNATTNLWFTTYLWGVIFLRNQTIPLFDGHNVKLFTINVVDNSHLA